MKLDLFDINKFIEANKCPKVSNPIFWNYDGTPTTDGLFSYELFGVTDEERKNTFGYIDLKGSYLHPMIFLMFVKKSGSLGDVVLGQKYAVMADGKIRIVPEDFKGAETGISFFYDNFEEIRKHWDNLISSDEVDSIDKSTRLKFLKSLKKEEFFVNKWLVLPPFYRAESSTNKSMGDSINKLYKELISRVSGMALGFSFSIFGEETKLRIQNILKDIYLAGLAPVSGKNLILEKGKTEGTLAGVSKNSMIRKHLLGKNIDWAASSVITSPENSKANTIDEKPVPFGYGAFPMATLISMFQPFYVNYCADFLEDMLSRFATDFATQIKKIDIAQFSTTKIEKMLKLFIKGPENRFDPIIFSFVDLNGKIVEVGKPIYEFKSKADAENGVNYVKRPMNMTDLFYNASKEILADKHVLVTRFPITNFQNIYPSKIKILTTSKTRPVYFKLYLDSTGYIFDENYPTIISNNNIDNKFYDVTICGNVYLDSLGGDYDGDMLYMRSLFTQEANNEAEKLIYSKTNLFNAKGELSRGLSKIGKEAVIALYEFTKQPE